MATQTLKVRKTKMEKMAQSGLAMATKANDFALKRTESVWMRSFATSEKCLGITEKVIKRGLEISASQQDLVFDLLESAKKKIVKK